MYKLNLLKVLLLLSTFTYGQEESKFSIGIHGGPSFVTWYNNPTKRLYLFRPAIIWGIKGQYDIKSWFSLCTEINYERKGRNINFVNSILSDPSTPETNPTFNFKGTMDYIVLPVMAKFKLGKKRTRCFIDVGSYGGYFLESGGRNSPYNCNLIDIGLVTGLGIDIAIRKHFQFSIEARNSIGIRKILKSDIINSKNESFALLLGLAYKI